jgi:hypothetical protein
LNVRSWSEHDDQYDNWPSRKRSPVSSSRTTVGDCYPALISIATRAATDRLLAHTNGR